MVGHGLTRRALALALGAAVVLGACSDRSNALDGKATRAAIVEAIGPDLPRSIATLDCPGRLPRGKGHPFTCRATLDDDRVVRVQVDQLGDDRLRAEILDAPLDMSDLTPAVQQTLKRRFQRSFLVSCRQKGRIVVAVGATLRCSAGDGDTTRQLGVKITDATGGFTVDVSA
jgi:hypothetical protein